VEAGAADADAADVGLGGAAAGDPGFLSSEASCRRGINESTAFAGKELDLQQQRRCALMKARGKPAGGYLAVCLAVRGEEHVALQLQGSPIDQPLAIQGKPGASSRRLKKPGMHLAAATCLPRRPAPRPARVAGLPPPPGGVTLLRDGRQ
jgi:hypothetical protein